MKFPSFRTHYNFKYLKQFAPALVMAVLLSAILSGVLIGVSSWSIGLAVAVAIPVSVVIVAAFLLLAGLLISWPNNKPVRYFQPEGADASKDVERENPKKFDHKPEPIQRSGARFSPAQDSKLLEGGHIEKYIGETLKLNQFATSATFRDLMTRYDEPKSQQSTLDVDTSCDPDETLHATVHFWGDNPPKPNVYRKCVQTELYDLRHIQSPQITNTNSKSVTVSDKVDDNGLGDKYYAEYGALFEPGIWYPLPMMTPEDELLALRLNNDIAFDIVRNDASDAYYICIKADKAEKIRVEYNLKQGRVAMHEPEKMRVTNIAMYESFKKLMHSINLTELKNIQVEFESNDVWREADEKTRLALLASYFRDFTSDKPEVIDSASSEMDKMQAMLTWQQGVCRHRAHLFFVLAKNLGIEARVVQNDLHAFVEVQIAGSWHGLDLGGAPQKIQLHDPHPEKSLFNSISGRVTPTFKQTNFERMLSDLETLMGKTKPSAHAFYRPQAFSSHPNSVEEFFARRPLDEAKFRVIFDAWKKIDGSVTKEIVEAVIADLNPQDRSIGQPFC